MPATQDLVTSRITIDKVIAAGLGLAGIWLSYRTLFGRDAGVSLLVVLLGPSVIQIMKTLTPVAAGAGAG